MSEEWTAKKHTAAKVACEIVNSERGPHDNEQIEEAENIMFVLMPDAVAEIERLQAQVAEMQPDWDTEGYLKAKREELADKAEHIECAQCGDNLNGEPYHVDGGRPFCCKECVADYFPEIAEE